MYKVVAERLDPDDMVYRMEYNWSATSFDCTVQPGGDSYIKLWLEDGRSIIQVPVSGRERDYQCVIVYGGRGEVIQYMKAVKGVVSKHLGPVVDR